MGCVVISDPDALKEVLQHGIATFQKDVKFTYKPFMEILGTGLVTSEGKHWMNQRKMVSLPLKVGILDIIPEIASRAVNRLIEKLLIYKMEQQPKQKQAQTQTQMKPYMHDKESMEETKGDNSEYTKLQPQTETEAEAEDGNGEGEGKVAEVLNEMGENFRHLTLQVIA